MKSLQFTGGLMILLIMVSGCTTVKRYRSASFKGRDDSLVDMELFGARLSEPADEATGKSLWDLSAGAQTQLIQILDGRYPGNEQFTLALNREYMAENLKPGTDNTRKDLRLVFTVSKKRDYAAIHKAQGIYSPADRIEYLDFSLEIPAGTHLHFTGWNRYATEYGEIEIADVSFSRSLGLEAEWSDKRTSGTAKSNISRIEEQLISSRYLKLNGTISDRSVRAEMEGSRGIDLTGNVIADVSLAFEGFPEKITVPLFAGPDEKGIQEVPALSFVDIKVPRMENAPDTLLGTLKLQYVYRHVEAGWKTFQEWDDRVAYYSGQLEKRIPLFKKADYVPVLYCLGNELKGREAIRIRTATSLQYPLQFRDFSEAVMFLDWLVNFSEGKKNTVPDEPVMAGGYTLIFRGEPLTPATVSGGELFRVMTVY